MCVLVCEGAEELRWSECDLRKETAPYYYLVPLQAKSVPQKSGAGFKVYRFGKFVTVQRKTAAALMAVG